MTDRNHSHDDTEMSMDEILASIKRYVADEAPETNLSGIDHHSGRTADVIKLTDAVDSTAPLEKSQFTPFAKTPAENVHHLYNNEQKYHKPTLSVVEKRYEEPHQHTTPQENYSHAKNFYHTEHEQQKSQSNEYTATQAKTPVEKPASIISEQTTQATTSAFSKLTEAFQAVKSEKKTQTTQNTSAIESFVIEMARPMIRQWIDENLPNLVNKLVTEEIQKLTDDLKKKIF